MNLINIFLPNSPDAITMDKQSPTVQTITKQLNKTGQIISAENTLFVYS